MAKADSNGNGTGHSSQPTVHFIVQGKGGIGKSVSPAGLPNS